MSLADNTPIRPAAPAPSTEASAAYKPPETKSEAVATVYELLGTEQKHLPKLTERVKDISSCLLGKFTRKNTVVALARKIDALVTQKIKPPEPASSSESFRTKITKALNWLDKLFGVTAEGAAENAMEELLGDLQDIQREEASTIHHALSGTHDPDLMLLTILDGAKNSRSGVQVSQAARRVNPSDEKITYFANALEQCNKVEEGSPTDKAMQQLRSSESRKTGNLCKQVDSLKPGEYLLANAGFTGHNVRMTWEKVSLKPDTYVCSLYNTGAASTTHDLVNNNRSVLPLRIKVVGKENKDKLLKKLRSEEACFSSESAYVAFIERVKSGKVDGCSAIPHDTYESLVGRDPPRLPSNVAYNLQCVGTCTHEALMAVAQDRCGEGGLHKIREAELTETAVKAKRLKKSLEHTGDYELGKSWWEQIKSRFRRLSPSTVTEERAGQQPSQITRITAIASRQLELLEREKLLRNLINWTTAHNIFQIRLPEIPPSPISLPV